MAQLTLCEFNTENLFISLEYHEGQSFDGMSEGEWRRLALKQLRHKQKPLRKLWGLARAIEDINPDILMLVEVGGKESLELFNHHFLNNNYVTYFIESNSNRSIDLAFLIKKHLPYEVQSHSHRETAIEVETYQGKHAAKFSRDVSELRLQKNGQLEMVLFLTHLKSKISTDRDFQGKDMRKAEAQALASLYKKRREEFPATPIVVAGDFNSELSSPELEALTKTDLMDLQEILKTPLEERVTLVHFDYKGIAHPQVLDYIMLSPQLKDKVVAGKSGVHRYRSFYDIPHPLPKTLSERYLQPSDHYPMVLVLDF